MSWRLRTPVVALLLATAATACGGSGSGDGTADADARSRELTAAAFPVALLAEPGGGFLYAERLTGAVRRVAADGTLDPSAVATIAVVGAPDDQRGLLGLARLANGGLYAAWTRARDARLVVGEVVAPRRTRPVWIGPVSADRANGGTLVARPDGTLLIGVGDLLEPAERGDRDTLANRKILALDPFGRPDQRPRILSRGWNNPFAMALDASGVVWVADNAPGDDAERIGRADEPAAQSKVLARAPDHIAPSVLVAIGDGLGVCGYLSSRMEAVVIDDGVPRATGTTLAAPCATGAAVLADGRIATATDTAIFLTST